MKRALISISSLFVIIVLYLALWPVPVEPVAWDAPKSPGLVEPFGPDDRIRHARGIDLGAHEGPEDAAPGRDGRLYVTVAGGKILQIDGYGNVREFADVGGRALGIEADSDGTFIVANAYLGLQRISRNGRVTTLLTEVGGEPLMYPNDVAIAHDGTIYFTEASRKFSPRDFGGTYQASLLDIMEHGGHGRVIRFDPASGEAAVLLDGLNFANGIAISEDQSFLVISDLGSYRILKHWLAGPNAGATEVLLDNLPAFADNINNGYNGRFWIGLIAPRNDLLDALSDKPFLRKAVQRLPAALRPKATPYSHVVAIDGDGTVLINLQDPAARYSSLTGVLETRDALYLTTLFGNALPVLDKDNL